MAEITQSMSGCSGNNLLRFFCLGYVEHGNIILRHDNLRRAHISKLFFFAKPAVIPESVADLAAADHDEPNLLGFGKLRPTQPARHQMGDTPGVGGCDDHQRPIGFDW